MKLVDIHDAVGHVLCHDITRIVRGGEKGVAFKKGHIVGPDDIETLLALGKRSLYIWENNPDMLHENEAAEALYALCANQHIERSEVREGKIDLFAAADGVLKLEMAALDAINQLGEMIIATRHTNYPVKKGDKLAGMRVIPLVIEKEKIAAATRIGVELGKPLFRILPYRKLTAAVITTGGEVYHGRIKDTFSDVIFAKLAEYDCAVVGHEIVDDDLNMICAAMRKYENADIIICTGGMSVDPDDLTPSAIREYGATIVTYGAPVLPGAMFLLAYKEKQAIMGLPSCVMYAKTTIFDLMLPRVVAGDSIDKKDIRHLWHGGLCLNCAECGYPGCCFGKGA